MNRKGKNLIRSERFLSTVKKYKRLLKLLVKILVSAGALYLVFSKIAFRQLVDVYQQLQPGWLFLALILFIISKAIAAYRLNYFFRSADVHLDNARNLRLYLLGMFYNMFLPGGIGGDGYKVFFLQKYYKTSTKKLLSAVILDRIMGLLALLVLAAGLVLFLDFPYDQFSWIAPLVLIPGYLILRWVFYRFFPSFRQILHRVLIYSGGVQLVQLFCAFAILQALGQHDLLLSYLFLFLLSSLAAAIPFTIGGAGARELTFLYGASFFQINVHLAVALSLTFYLITLLVSLSGIIYVFNSQAIHRNLGDG
jgi:hypothetical protein